MDQTELFIHLQRIIIIIIISSFFFKLINCMQNICIKFGLFSLFNGISTVLGYLKPRQFYKKDSRGAV